jgi:hypothetical protein
MPDQEPTETSAEVDMAHYSRALDEIYRLRSLLAYEATVLDAHLEYKTFPKSRRPIAEQQSARMRVAASGTDVTRYISHLSLRHARAKANVPQTLTRAGWEQTGE